MKSVHDDGKATKLTEAARRDGFVKGAKDKLLYKKPGEPVN
jgi:hypothetical protein